MKRRTLLCGLLAATGAGPAAGEGQLYLRTFRVPPDFLLHGIPAEAREAIRDDPFADLDLPPSRTAVEVLTGQGVAFPEGASAFFNPANSTLVVRNTPANMDLVDAFATRLRNATISQCRVHIEIHRLSRADADSLEAAHAAGDPAVELLASVDALGAAGKADTVAHFCATTRSGHEARNGRGRPASGCLIKLKPRIDPESGEISVSAGLVFDGEPCDKSTKLASGTTAYLGQINATDSHATIAFIAADILPFGTP